MEALKMTYKEREAEKAINWASERKKELSAQYNIDAGKIVWLGGNTFVLCYSPTRQVQV
jgi:hypothetical protein